MHRVCLFVAALLAAPAAAQSPAPFLWELRAPQGAVVHHLLGSVHLLPPSAHPLPPALEDAYRDAELLVVESDLEALSSADAQMQLLGAAQSDAPEGLRAEIDAETYARLGRQARAVGLPPEFCDAFHAWFCALTLEVTGFLRAGFSPELGVDQHYYGRARRDGKAVAWLESPEEHLALFMQMPERLGAAFLEATLDAYAAQTATPAALVRAWRSGDVAFMRARVEDLRAAHPDAHARLLADRNRAWLKPLDFWLRDTRPALVIVGAAHLIGDDGLVELLSRQGFALEAVGDGP